MSVGMDNKLISAKGLLLRVAARSENANSFGLYNHVMIARDGRAFVGLRSRGTWNTEYPKGTDVRVSEYTYRSGTRIVDAEGQFECFRSFEPAPAAVVAELFRQ